MSAELKACPFCGGDKHMVLPPNCTKTGDYNHGDNAQPIVRCLICCAEAMGKPWDYTKESAVTTWNRRTDLSQAAVAAALEAAAKQVGDHGEWMKSHNLIGNGYDFVGQAKAIRALITQPQHDALAAHVAAEVAKARAEDAELLYNAWLGLRVLENIAKVKGLSGAADVTTPLLAEIEAAHPEFAPRSALPRPDRSQAMTAPEKIWIAGPASECGHYYPNATEAEGEHGGQAVEYTRTDLIAARPAPAIEPQGLVQNDTIDSFCLTLRRLVSDAYAERDRFSHIAATIRINALHNGATNAEVDAMLSGDVSFLNWIAAKVEALAARPAADTRTVTVAQLECWAEGLHYAYADPDHKIRCKSEDEIRAIIGDTE